MIKYFLGLIIFVLFTISLFAQAPKSFKYQALVRNSTGQIVQNQNVSFRINILEGSMTGNSVYEETHILQTTEFGIANFNIGQGSVTSGNFNIINWGSNSFFVKTEFDETGATNYQFMGVSQLLSVPYALYSETSGSADASMWQSNANNIYFNQGNVGIGENSPTGKLVVKSDSTAVTDDVIFSVLNAQGDTVFAVYQDGVRINVADNPAKATSSKGGFAVGGFSPAKGTITNEYLRVTPDSVRVYIEENNTAKATSSKGGFAVGGFSPSKTLINDYLSVNSDSVKVSKSLYIPRMTTAERDALGFVPSEALIIFNMTDKCMQIFEDNVWSNIWCFNCAPTVMTQPFDATICNGQDTSFTITSTGTNLVYQWQLSTDGGTVWNNISNGSTNPTYSGVSTFTLSLTNVPVSCNGYKYRCNVSASCPPVATSEEAILNVATPSLSIISQPTNQQAISNCSASFSFTTSSFGQCQWQLSTDAGSTWNNISDGGTAPLYSGTTSTNLSLSNVPSSFNNYKYKCIVNNPCGSGDTTDNATLFVNMFATVATNIDYVSFTANWDVVPLATAYYLDVSTNSSFSTFVSGFNNLNVGNVLTYNVSGLVANTPYYYRIRANAPCGSSVNSNTVTITTFGHTIGESYGGGIIFYIDGTGQHGLIAATSNQSTSAAWGCYGTAITGADGTAIGTGAQNTIDIEVGCTTSGIAADIAANLVLNSYSDWFLPSKDELNKMFVNKTAIGGFTNNYYWSSSEASINNAWAQDFNTGGQYGNSRNVPSYVRAIRTF